MAKLLNLSAPDFEPVLQDLGVDPESLQLVDPAPPAPDARNTPKLGRGAVLVGQIGAGLDIPRAATAYRRLADQALTEEAPALFFLKDQRTDGELARWRNALWPWLHVIAIYRIVAGRTERENLQGRQVLAGTCSKDRVLLAARRREHVLSPRATTEKFDQNAQGWNGRPGEPGYAHFRWMRRYVGQFARPRDGQRILDFGCGAGWVGIEAARCAKNVQLCAFDPSPEMVRIAGENAAAQGITGFQGRTGFGDAPPFPAPGEPGFDIVYSSGVVSFAPDHERFAAGLAATLAPGGTLVVGDIHRNARGMRRRRKERTLLPAREMNALTRAEMCVLLERRGLVLEAAAGYQLTWPVPQAMHWSDTRMRGALTPPLVLANALLAGKPLGEDTFDSWVVRLRLP